jgi:ParB family chromosome partitioning protein
MPDLPIRSIQIGPRHRKDLGDLRPLSESLERVGLLHSVVVDANHRLIAGMRRLEAAKLLGWKTIPVRVVALDRLVEGEFAENALRKDFTLSEIAAIAQELRPKVEEQARERKLGGLNRGKKSPVVVNCHHGETGKTRERIARACGISGRTLDKIEEVVEAAEKNPKKFGAFKAEMDSSGKVDASWKRLRLEVERQKASKTKPKCDSEENILVGDMSLLWDKLEDESADLFFSDPVYQDVQAYENLSELAAAKLRPGGLCLAYTGHLRLPEVLVAMGKHLQYWWMFAVKFADQPKAIHGRHVQNRWRAIVAFAKPPLKAGSDWVADLVEGSGRDETYHEWGQGEGEAAYLIERLTMPNSLIVDPYCGGGAISAAAKATGRRWVATEKDRTTAQVARKRLAGMKSKKASGQ